MKTIETIAVVSENGQLSVRIPVTLSPGKRRVVLVVDEEPVEQPAYTPLKLHVWRLEGWPADCTFRREDIYGDDGR